MSREAGDTSTTSTAAVSAAPELADLFAAHATALVRTLSVAGLPDARDAVQEAFVQAFVHWRRISRYDDPVAWIRRVAINRALNRRRGHRRQAALAQRLGELPTETAEPLPVRDDDVLAAVEQLPPQQRLAVTLFYFSDLAVADVAAAMGISDGAVKYHLHAARTSIGRALEVRDVLR
jgi:RNA polymerase sigma-70 factor (ECF subfamily)